MHFSIICSASKEIFKKNAPGTTSAKRVWLQSNLHVLHDDVIKWKHFPRYWPFVRGIHRSPVNSPHKGQWRGDVFFDLPLNKRLRKQWCGWWFETPSRPVWRHCNVDCGPAFAISRKVRPDHFAVTFDALDCEMPRFDTILRFKNKTFTTVKLHHRVCKVLGCVRLAHWC